MRLLVTGASGFLGSSCCDLATSRGHDVTAVSRRSRCSVSDLRGSHLHWIRSDLHKLNAAHLKDVDAILHFAAATIGSPGPTWTELIQANITLTAHLCNLAADSGVPILIAGSSKEYGAASDQHSFIPVNAELLPLSPYAASKAAASIIATSIGRCRFNQTIYLRIFNAYGINQTLLSLWPSLRAAALSGSDFNLSSGQQVRDFIAADVVAAMVIAVAENLHQLDQGVTVFNIGSGQPQTVLEFCQQWWRTWKADGRLLIGHQPLRADDVQRSVADVSNHPDWLRSLNEG